MKISIFDLDKTLLRVNSSFEYSKFLYRKKVFSFWALVFSFWCNFRHRFLGLSLEGLHETVFHTLVKGLSLQTFEKNVAEFLEDFLKWGIYPPAYQELLEVKAKGHYMVIISSSPSFLVAPLAAFFGVDAWGATEYRVDKDKLLCNIAILMEGAAKAAFAEKIRESLGSHKEDITVYTDSHLDLPLLLAGGTQVAVNPDRKLKRIAKRQNWRVI